MRVNMATVSTLREASGVSAALTKRVAILYRGIAFQAIIAVLSSFRICTLQKHRMIRGFDSRRLHQA
jgi:hypothetical protein